MIKTPVNNFKYYLELCKINIMIPVSLTGFTGYFINYPQLTINSILITFGIFLLAVSASILNQIQEVNLDQRMERTHNRPLPAKKITIPQAMILFLITLCIGIAIIYFQGNFKAALIGLITIIWYNGVYTYLKKVTAFAVVPGAITGALPPLIGWVAAGGGIIDKPIIFLEFLIFIGQIPHFWLLILKYGGEYKKAGIPTVQEIFNVNEINRLTFSWVLVSVIAAMYLCYFEIIQSKLTICVLLAASAIIVYQFFALYNIKSDKIDYKKYSISLDLYFFLILLLLISDKILI
jgi:heme o synthase